MNPDVGCSPDFLLKRLDAGAQDDVAPGVQSDSANSETDTLSSASIQKCSVSDDVLLERVGDGEREALSLLFRRHARAVRNVAYRILRNEADADDLVQEVFLFLFQKARLYDPEKSSAASWIIQMTYHRSIDRRRYLEVRHQYDSQELHEERLPTTNGRVSIDEIAGRTLLSRLRHELSAEQRQTLELHFFEGYSFREIAGKTGQTIGNVRNHYYRGMERLRSYVSQEKRL
jgi:RNA polymerase sigma-70 factor (ECF subfamily)